MASSGLFQSRTFLPKPPISPRLSQTAMSVSKAAAAAREKLCCRHIKLEALTGIIPVKEYGGGRE